MSPAKKKNRTDHPDSSDDRELENRELKTHSDDSLGDSQGDDTLSEEPGLQNRLDPDPEQPNWDPDPARCRQRVEAVLFLAKGPLASRKISQLAGVEDGTRARTLIKELNQHYDNVGRAFHIKRIAGGYRMLTRPRFAKWIRRQDHIKPYRRLSAPNIETLAVVAYRQPIIKAEIEAIRGVSCGEILRQLLEKGLIKIAGRSSELGRPYLYATSRHFLAVFGLNSLSDLPRASELVGKGLPQWAVSVNNSGPRDDQLTRDESGEEYLDEELEDDDEYDEDDEDFEDEYDDEYDDNEDDSANEDDD